MNHIKVFLQYNSLVVYPYHRCLKLAGFYDGIIFGLMGLIACADKDATDTVEEVETDTGTNLDTFGVTDPVFFRLVWLA